MARSRIPFTILPAAALCLLSLPGISGGEGFRIEAETYSNYGNISGQGIAQHSCSGASNGYGVNGVDIAGEWISWQVTFDQRFCCTDSLRSAGSNGFVRQFDLIFQRADGGEIVCTDSFYTPPGSGVG